MTSLINWLLIGAGDIAAKRVAEAIAGTEGSHLRAVCDSVPEKARDIARRYGAEVVHSDYQDALGDKSIDAVYVATPVYLHSEMAIEAIRAGKHVLVEKPLGLGCQDAQEIVQAADSSGLTCACAYFRRLYSRYAMLTDMIQRQRLGEIVLVRMAYYSWFDPGMEDPKYWRVVREKSGGGPLADMGSHMFDVLIGLFGLPVKLSASNITACRDWNVEDGSVSIMRLADGGQITASFNWSSRTWIHMFEVVGTEGRVLWQPYDTGPVVRTMGRSVTEFDMPPSENVHQPLIEDFIASVREGRQPACPISEAALTNRLIDAIYRAASTHREVAV